MPPEATGLILGIVIGAICAVILVLLLGTVLGRGATSGFDTVVKVIAQLTALAAFMFGGPFLGGVILEGLDLSVAQGFYVLGLGIVFSPAAIYLVLKRTIALGREIGE